MPGHFTFARIHHASPFSSREEQGALRGLQNAHFQADFRIFAEIGGQMPRRIVDLEDASSSPVGHPRCKSLQPKWFLLTPESSSE